ncbi:DUF732 domain-containing protein [Actinomadura opuntiae]|uniref:DUF732 domain-containing protein n=1 Tax=Actinomadura sp. OS1-43 TaxID=604315 RepID=UPI00255A9890|nr:DUF732 domain-containing protein [Actinomadura sp. OS1-43]MDL4818372.1 DUF732 domain-containing protein [Actinomadura sp. OS1-43]
MQKYVVAAVATVAAVIVIVAGVVAFVALSNDNSHTAGRAAHSAPAATPSTSHKPRPTVTVTRPAPQHTVVVPPPTPTSDEDANFLALIASDGIKAPDDWAINAGHVTCGEDYATAYAYLTDGGIYPYHVQTFLDDWTTTHDGC